VCRKEGRCGIAAVNDTTTEMFKEIFWTEMGQELNVTDKQKF
jgi:hypothetical protein